MSAFDNMKKLDQKANEEGVNTLSSLELAVWRSDSITAADELAALRKRVVELEMVVREIADPKNGYKRDGSVYIPDVVQAAARAVLEGNQ